MCVLYYGSTLYVVIQENAFETFVLAVLVSLANAIYHIIWNM